MDLPEISSIAVSVIPSRNPEIKLHTSLARAKSALQVVTRSNAFNQYVFEEHNTKPDTGEVYAIRNGKWHLAYHVSGGEIIEDL